MPLPECGGDLWSKTVVMFAKLQLKRSRKTFVTYALDAYLAGLE